MLYILQLCGILTVDTICAQATEKARQFAKQACQDCDDPGADIFSKTEENKTMCLANGEDITQLVLSPPIGKDGPEKPRSEIAIQKAALLSFQTWAVRTPGIVGVLIGQVVKNRIACHSVVVSTTIEELINAQKVKAVCESNSMNIYGVVLAGQFGDTENAALGRSYLAALKDASHVDASNCVFAAWLALGIYNSIYIYVCVCGVIYNMIELHHVMSSLFMKFFQVDPEMPGQLTITELIQAHEQVLEERKPVWTHMRSQALGTLCWVEDLLESSRTRLYKQVIKAVLKNIDASPDNEPKLLSFTVVSIPADGRCGWRSILASIDPRAYQSVPRSALVSARVAVGHSYIG